jgi:hypothetical protein
MSLDRDAQDTRDIAVETRTELRSINSKLDDFIAESRRHREAQDARHKCIEQKISAFQSIVDQATGASWASRGLFGLGALFLGWIGAHLPNFSTFGSPPSH